MKDRDGNEFVWVPVNPSKEMFKAAESLHSDRYVAMGTALDYWTAMLAEAPQFVAGEVTEEMCQRVAASFYGADTFANGVEMHEALQLWRKELGPALGLVEIREPSDDECIAINEHVLRAHGIEGCGAVLNGRVIFDAVAKRLKGEL